MNVHNLSDFTKGWFIGNFKPAFAQSSAFECAVKKYKAGEREPKHYHALATEFTVIATGWVRMNGVEYGPDSIIEIMPGVATDFEAVTDTITFVVKIPAASGDKFLGEP